MSGYEINEKDIVNIMRILEVLDPENTSREDAIKTLEYLRALGKSAANADPKFIKSFLEEIKRKKQEFKDLEKKLEDENKDSEE